MKNQIQGRTLVQRRQFIHKLAALVGSGGFGLVFPRIALSAQVDSGVRPPLRLICYSFPNGCQPELWNFAEALAPLVEFRDQIHVLSGLKNEVVEGTAGDQHEQGGASLFTGGITLGDAVVSRPSLDSVVAQFANTTVLKRPLATGVTRGIAGGMKRPTTWRRRSWNLNGEPNAFEANPYVLLNDLFGESSTGFSNAKENMLLSRQIMKEYQSLKQRSSFLSQAAVRSISIHLDQLKQLEVESLRLQLEASNERACKLPERSGFEVLLKERLVLSDSLYEPVFRMQCQLMVSALHCDLVRTGSLMFGNSGDDYFAPGMDLGDHDTSHYTGATSEAVYRKYRQLHMSNLKNLVSQLSELTDFDGSRLIDNTVILVGSEFGDGRAHVISPQPHLIVGGQKVLSKGKEWNFELKKTPAHVYATIEQIFRTYYGVTAEGAKRNFSDDPIAGLSSTI